MVRLNEAEYDARAFEERGIRHHDLHFDDCTSPPPAVARAFFAATDAAVDGGGMVAVHCKAGLGRTGTMIALYMMRTLGFGAREAMGWLRVMRPGSVIGPQQHFLCAAEQGDACCIQVTAALQGGRPPSAALAAQVAGAVERL